MVVAGKKALACAAFGSLLAALTFEISKFAVLSSDSTINAAQLVILAFLMPGLTCAFAWSSSGNVHAFHLWMAMLGNFVFYFALCWIIVSLGRKLLRRRA